MSSSDPTLHELRTALSFPAPTDALSMSRRHFLQASAAGIGVSMLPTWMADAAGAAPAAPTGEGILVLVVLDGGNDGLHMAPPVGIGAYHDARGALAFTESQVLGIGDGRGLHPALTRLKSRFDLGGVAILDGVGNARRDLSHFSAMADFHAGGPAGQLGRTGWIGRYLDQSTGGPFEAIAIGERIPMVAHGLTRAAVALPSSRDLVPERRSWSGPMEQAVAQWSQVATGHGTLADHVAGITASVFEASDAFLPSYPTVTPETPLVEELQLCANLVNANLGTRVFTVNHGPYDSHTEQRAMLDARMAELDEAIDVFFQTLDAGVADDVTLVCISEFGRRVAANGGLGTDHGAGNSMLAVGSRVVGGLHGSLPSLTSLTPDGNLTHEIDYRSVFATLLDEVLGVDHSAILGSEFATVPFIGEPTPPPPPPPPPSPPPPPPDPGQTSKWPFRPRRWTPPGGTASTVADGTVATSDDADTLRMYRAFTDKEPDAAVAKKLTKARTRGMSSEAIADRLGLTSDLESRYASMTDDRFLEASYRRLLGRELDAAGRRRWLSSSDRQELNRAEAIRWISSTPEFRERFPYKALRR